jgi:hypothetical protein
MLAEAYQGFKMTFTISVGKRKKKFLDFGKVSEEVTALLDSDADIKKLKVGTKEDGDEDAAIDFLKEHVKCCQSLPLPEGKPDDNYEIRKNYLKHEFNIQLDYLRKHFGPKP